MQTVEVIPICFPKHSFISTLRGRLKSRLAGNGTTNRHFAALVNLAIAPLKGAGPINLPLNHLASCPHLSRFLRAAWVRPITGDKHPGGLHGTDGVDHLLGGVGAAPGDEEDRGVETY
jgi:hypothetical protein